MFIKPILYNQAATESAGMAGSESTPPVVNSETAPVGNPFTEAGELVLPNRVGEPTPAPETLQQFPPTVPPVTESGMSPEKLTQLAAETAVKEMQKLRESTAPAASVKPPAPPTQPYTDADFRRDFKVVDLNEKNFTEIFGYVPEKPEQVVAANRFFQNLVVQAVTMSNFLAKQESDRFRNEYSSTVNPLVQERTQRYETDLRNRFHTQNPDLKGYGALIDEITKDLNNQYRQGLFKVEGTTQAEREAFAFNFVAARARKLLNLPNTPIGQSSAQTQQGQNTTTTTQTTPQRRMPPLSSGGRSSGTGAATGQESSGVNLRSLFE